MSYCDIAPGHPFHGPYHDEEYGFPIADDNALFSGLVFIGVLGLLLAPFIHRVMHRLHMDYKEDS